MDNPFMYVDTNLIGCLTLMEEMKRRKVMKLVQASTSSVYAGLGLPYVEDLPVNTPISPYAVSKRSAELMTYTYHHLYGIDVSVPRYFTVYGPAGRPDMSVYRIIKSINEGGVFELFGDGSQSRDFTYVDDIARGNVAALRNVGYEIFNLGGGNNPCELTTIISYVEDKLNKKSIVNTQSFHSADVKSTWANIDKAKKILNWEPQIKLTEGLNRTIKWYLENREFCKNI
jgi:nucleoside-diphosphate-sugar epimerase